jgi:hypothetical protein
MRRQGTVMFREKHITLYLTVLYTKYSNDKIFRGCRVESSMPTAGLMLRSHCPIDRYGISVRANTQWTAIREHLLKDKISLNIG